MNEDLGAVVDGIMNAVGDKASREEVESDLKKFIEYGVPVEQARQAVIKKYGGSTVSYSEIEKKLGEVEPDDKRLSFVGKIVALEERDVEVKGEKKKIFRGLIGDETAVLPFTAWKDFGLEQDDVIRIKNSSAGEWGGQPRLNLSEWTEVEKIDENIETIKRKAQHHSIMDLKSGLSNIEVKAKVLTMEEREVSVGEADKKVYTGVMGDETGKIRYTSWVDFGVKEGDVIRIEGAYIKSWRGAPQLVFDEKSKVEKLEEKMPDEFIASKKTQIYRVVEAGGGVELGIDGVIIEIQDGSGLIYRCPKCNRAIRDGLCVVDGEVDGVSDLRIKAIVDDGTGAVNAIIDRGVTEKITGKNLKEYEEMAKDAASVAEDDMKSMLIARPIHITGNALSDEYGVTIIVQDAEMVTPAVQQERDELMAKMGAMK